LSRLKLNRFGGLTELRLSDNEFSREINWVQTDLQKAESDHLISLEERFQIAMARQ
jgi:hypothetical protein